MRNSNLPDIKKESVFLRIKNWFKEIFNKKQDVEKIGREEININNFIEEQKTNDFKEKLQVKSNDRILFLMKKFDDNEIDISEIKESEIDELISLYKKMIKEKKEKINYYSTIMGKKEGIV